VVYAGTSKERWISWTSPHWEPLIDMFSKSRINLRSGISRSLGLQIFHNISMVKVDLITYRKRDGAGRSNLETTNPNHMQIRVMISRKRTLESGVSSTRALGTTLLLPLEIVIVGRA
jgi:hypothetical protein